jgi:thioredoxin reductase
MRLAEPPYDLVVVGGGIIGMTAAQLATRLVAIGSQGGSGVDLAPALATRGLADMGL